MQLPAALDDVELIVGDSHCLFAAMSFGKIQEKHPWSAPNQKIVLAHGALGLVRAAYIPINRESDFFLQTEGIWKINEDYWNLLQSFSQSKSRCLISFNGNEHNSRFLRQHIAPFDFWDDRVPVIQSRRHILPRSTIVRQLQNAALSARRKARELCKFFPVHRIIALAPPPPIRSARDILSKPEVFDFRDRHIENEWVRMKIYFCYCDLLREAYDSLNILFQTSCSSACDFDGFLLSEFAHGATHANEDYYAKALACGTLKTSKSKEDYESL